MTDYDHARLALLASVTATTLLAAVNAFAGSITTVVGLAVVLLLDLSLWRVLYTAERVDRERRRR